MRVIAGKYRGKRLFAPADQSVRPTTDRIKETVFNILSHRIDWDGCTVLDLFAGSGALGIEAASRGAAKVVLVDKSPDSIRLLTQNLRHVGLQAEVYTADYRVALKKSEGRTFDLILIDPPYAEQLEGEALRLIAQYGLLSRRGVIFVEHSRKNDLIKVPECFIIETRHCGTTDISFLGYKEEAGVKDGTVCRIV